MSENTEKTLFPEGNWILPARDEPGESPPAAASLTAAGLAARLAVAPATVANWLRLGVLRYDLGQAFSAAYARGVEAELAAGLSRLTSRRNKSARHGPELYASYISSVRNREIVERVRRSGAVRSERGLRILLAHFAAGLFLTALGRKPRGSPLEQIRRGGAACAGFRSLLDDLLRGRWPAADEQKALRALGDLSPEYVRGEDTLGFAYLSLRDLARRRSEGAYFTPPRVIGTLLSHLDDALSRGGNVCDPCCGSGGFLMSLAARGVPLPRLYGLDSDETAVELARLNLALLSPAAEAPVLRRQLAAADTLLSRISLKFDLVLGNPPWGGAFTPAERRVLGRSFALARASGKLESFALFVEKALGLLSDGGLMAFVLPEAALTVRAHRPLRRLLLEHCSLSFADYLGCPFKGVACPAVILGARRTGGGTARGCVVSRGRERFVISGERGLYDGDLLLSLSDEDDRCLRKILALRDAAYLKGHARFTLGIVTGANAGCLRDGPAEGCEPVYTGAQVKKYGLDRPAAFIRFEPARYQQVGPVENYRAREKLIYRFISPVPVFAYDDRQRLTLNSANLLTPEFGDLGIKYVLAVLNSSVSVFFLRRRFNAVKLLRSHLEALPIPRAPAPVRERVTSLVEAILSDPRSRPDLYREIDAEILGLYELDAEERRTVTDFARTQRLLLKGT